MTATTAGYADPVDYSAYGQYRINRSPDDPRPLYRFTGRITADGSSGLPAEPGRYHIYAGWFCTSAQRVTIQRALNGLEDVISVSYVDNVRDGRGWAFRETNGPDPVNGFTLLRDAYEATEPGFDGHVSVPTLWDRVTGTVLSNDYRTIGIDLATQFGAWSNGADTYPTALESEIEHWEGRVEPETFGTLDALLGDNDRRFLLGDRLTDADVRVWVHLVRSNDPSLTAYPHLWRYATELYRSPAFRDTTRLETFSPLPAWTTL
jgi:putative glutathione S-transferase